MYPRVYTRSLSVSLDIQSACCSVLTYKTDIIELASRKHYRFLSLVPNIGIAKHLSLNIFSSWCNGGGPNSSLQ